MIFLGMAYTQKMKSFWNMNQPKFRVMNDGTVTLNVWKMRSSTDFLSYLKFEFIQYILYGAYLVTGFLVMPRQNAFMVFPIYQTQNAELRDVKYNYINMIYMGINVFQLLFLRVLLSPWRESVENENDRRTKKLFCTLIWAIVGIIAVMSAGTLSFIIYNYEEIDLFGKAREKTILLLWIEV